MSYKIILTKQGKKDYELVKKSQYATKTKELFYLLSTNPTDIETCEQLIGNLMGFYSIRINRQHRIVYKIYTDKQIVEIYRMWGHYE